MKIKKNHKKSALLATFISAVAVVIQIFIIGYFGRINEEFISYIAIIEITVVISFAMSFFAGEQYLINFYNKQKYDKRRLFYFLSIIVLFNLSMFFILFYLGMNLNIINDIKLEFHYFMMLFFISVFTSLSIIISILFKADFNFLKSIICEKIYIIISMFGLFIFYSIFSIVNNDLIFYMSFFASLLSISISLLVFYKKTSKMHRKLSFCDFKTFFYKYSSKEGLFFYLTIIVIIIYERIDQVLIITLIGTSSLAAYYALFKLSYGVRFLTRSINTIFYAFLSKNFSHTDSLLMYKFNRNLNFVISLIFTIIILMFSQKVIYLFFGQNFVKYSLILEIMSVGLLFSSLNQVDFNFLNSKGYSKLFFKNSVLTVFIQLLVIVLTYKKYGLIGFAFAKLSAVIVGSLYSYYYLRSYSKENYALIVSFVFLIYLLVRSV